VVMAGRTDSWVLLALDTGSLPFGLRPCRPTPCRRPGLALPLRPLGIGPCQRVHGNHPRRPRRPCPCRWPREWPWRCWRGLFSFSSAPCRRPCRQVATAKVTYLPNRFGPPSVGDCGVRWLEALGAWDVCSLRAAAGKWAPAQRVSLLLTSSTSTTTAAADIASHIRRPEIHKLQTGLLERTGTLHNFELCCETIRRLTSRQLTPTTAADRKSVV
jgi:hypothetical protein